MQINKLPCGAGPLPSRIENCLELIDGIIRSGTLRPGEASSVFQKLRFLGSELHGRCGLTALQAVSARQREAFSSITPALVSSFAWLRKLVQHVQPRTWPWGVATPDVSHVFGDASEPSPQQGLHPTLGGVLLRAGQPLEVFSVEIPARLINVLPRRQKKIYYYELLWPVVAAFAWRNEFLSAHSIFYEDNSGAQNNLLPFSSMDYEDPFTRQSSRLPDKTRFARLSSARRRLDQQRAF